MNVRTSNISLIIFISLMGGSVLLSNANAEPRDIKGQFGVVKCIAYSDDGKLVAFGSLDGSIRIASVQDLKTPLQSHSIHDGLVTSLQFIPKGMLVASSGKSGEVKIFDQKSGKVKHTWQDQRLAVCISAFKDGDRLLVIYNDGSAAIRDVTKGNSLQSFQPDDAFKRSAMGRRLAHALSHDEKYIAIGIPGLANDSTIAIWDIGSGKMINALSISSVSLAFSPDTKLLAILTNDQHLQITDLKSSKIVKDLKVPGEATSIAYCTDGATLAIGTRHTYGNGVFIEDESKGGRVLIVDTLNNNIKETLHGFTHSVYNVAYSPDGKYLAAASAGHVRVWPRD